ncbi:MAG: hypothetical protein NT075_00665, partial [Chloroflexi bacterium]|nr:hypothetical protein [Chloroflexota bacterium]
MAQVTTLSRPTSTHFLRRWTTADGRIEALIVLLLLAFSIAMFYPFVWLFFSSFKNGDDIVRIPVTLLPKQWTLSAYGMLFDPERANIGQAFLNSFIITIGTVITVLFTSSLGGFVFARLDFPGRKVLFYFIL